MICVGRGPSRFACQGSEVAVLAAIQGSDSIPAWEPMARNKSIEPGDRNAPLSRVLVGRICLLGRRVVMGVEGRVGSELLTWEFAPQTVRGENFDHVESPS